MVLRQHDPLEELGLIERLIECEPRAEPLMEATPEPIALAHIPNVWRAESLALADQGRIATGHEVLDVALGGGWPAPALIEVLGDHVGIGELQLLRSLWQPRCLQGCNEQRSVVLWLNALYAVQAVALVQLGLDPSRHWCARDLTERDVLWSMEQALRSGSCALVMAWSKTVSLAMLRRLKLAASAHDSVGVLFRPSALAATASPATLRLRLRPALEQLQIELLKVQGRRPCTLQLSLQARTQRSQMRPLA